MSTGGNWGFLERCTHTHTESGTEKQDKPGTEDLVSDFDLGIISQLSGHWYVA